MDLTVIKTIFPFCAISILVSTDLVCRQQNAQLYEPLRRCFWVFKSMGNPVAGEVGCEESGGHLATIDNVDVSMFIGTIDIGDTFFYIGVHDSGDGLWRSWNNTLMEWTNWAPDQPDGDQRVDAQPCVIVQKSDMEWFDLSCTDIGQNEHFALCEAEASTLETTSSTTSTTQSTPTPATTTVLTTSMTERMTLPESTTQLQIRTSTTPLNRTCKGKRQMEKPCLSRSHCTCRCTTPAKSHSNLTAAIETVKRELKIDVTNTSQHKRKYESASDPRASAKATGIIGIVITSVLFLSIMSLDLIPT